MEYELRKIGVKTAAVIDMRTDSLQQNTINGILCVGRFNGGWGDVENTAGTFKSGDPDAEVRGIAVTWMGYTWALHKAIERGCNVQT